MSIFLNRKVVVQKGIQSSENSSKLPSYFFQWYGMVGVPVCICTLWNNLNSTMA